MADRILFQAEIDAALHERTTTQKDRFRLTNAQFMREALEALCAKLEAIPSPFEAERAAE